MDSSSTEPSVSPAKPEKKNLGWLWIVAAAGVYFALQLWILPAFGVPT